MDTLALTLAAVLLSLADRHPAGRLGGPVPRAGRLVHAGARRHAGDADVRLSGAADAVLPHRPGRRRHRDADLRDAAGDPAHRARHPPGAARPPWRRAGRSARPAGRSLRTVQLPLAKRTIVLGINQTTMAALSMVTIAALIDAPGPGPGRAAGAARSTSVGAFTGGLAIVIMAIVLDRVTTAASDRAEASYRAGARTRSPSAATAAAHRRRRAHRGRGLPVLHATTGRPCSPGRRRGGVIGFTIDDAVNAAADWTRLNLHDVTSAIKNVVTYGLINPLQALLAESPWYLVCAVVLALTGQWPGRARVDRRERLPRPAGRHRPVGDRRW